MHGTVSSPTITHASDTRHYHAVTMPVPASLHVMPVYATIRWYDANPHTRVASSTMLHDTIRDDTAHGSTRSAAVRAGCRRNRIVARCGGRAQALVILAEL
jgi:hypothetical protein